MIFFFVFLCVLQFLCERIYNEKHLNGIKRRRKKNVWKRFRIWIENCRNSLIVLNVINYLMLSKWCIMVIFGIVKWLDKTTLFLMVMRNWVRVYSLHFVMMLYGCVCLLACFYMRMHIQVFMCASVCVCVKNIETLLCYPIL